MDLTEERKQTRLQCNERLLTVLSGLRKINPETDEDKSYNNALGDAYDYILTTEESCLYQHTVYCGKWVRDK